MANFAIIETGGKQYKAVPGTKIKVEKLLGEQGAVITFDKVLLAANGDNVQIGTPYLAGTTVTGTVVRQARAKKVIVYRYHSKNRYDKKRGHRQHFTEITIT